MRERQADAVAALRETLAAIDNAEAIDASAAPPVQHGVIAGGVAGLGAGEVPEALHVVINSIAESINADAWSATGRLSCRNIVGVVGIEPTTCTV